MAGNATSSRRRPQISFANSQYSKKSLARSKESVGGEGD